MSIHDDFTLQNRPHPLLSNWQKECGLVFGKNKEKPLKTRGFQELGLSKLNRIGKKAGRNILLFLVGIGFGIGFCENAYF